MTSMKSIIPLLSSPSSSSLLTPFLVAATTELLVATTVAVLVPTNSFLRVMIIDCATAPGYWFTFLLLAWIFLVLRAISGSLVYLMRSSQQNIQYSQLISNQEQEEEDNRMEQEDNGESMQRVSSPPSTTNFRLRILHDIILIFLVYLALCLTARMAWAPPTFNLNAMDGSQASLPESLLLGAATSSYQVEGHMDNNQWAAFENTTNIERCGAAADVWNQFEVDLHDRIVDDLHLDAYRLSMEWARIEPVQGSFDMEALDRYKQWLRMLHEHGIQTLVTLHHFTNPLWFEELGAFENRNASNLMLPYVTTVVQELDPYVDYWTTFNEIMVYAGNGYLMGDFPPGKSGEIGTMLSVVQNMLDCHMDLYHAIHEISPTAQVSIAKNTILYHPHSYWDLGAIVSAAVSDLYYNKLPIRYLQRKPTSTLDYLGLNTYFRLKVGRIGASMGFVFPPEQQSDMGWDLDPQVLYQVVHQYHQYAPQTDLIITEHGVADGERPDQRRVAFLRDSLLGLAVAINRDAIPVVGYMHWSLISNFEWNSGYRPDFGLYHIDLPHSQERNLTEGGRLYRDVIANRKIPLADDGHL